MGKKLFDMVFSRINSCANFEHRIMDVSNGLLMWATLNARFDKFDFTIIKRDGSYIVQSLEEYEFEEANTEKEKFLQNVIVGFNGKVLSFNPDKRSEWPGEKFLKIHNECFNENRENLKLKAAAEAQDLESDDDIEGVERVYTDYKVETWLKTSYCLGTNPYNLPPPTLFHSLQYTLLYSSHTL